MRGRPSRRLAALAGPVYAELLSGVIASVIGTFWVAGLRRGGRRRRHPAVGATAARTRRGTGAAAGRIVRAGAPFGLDFTARMAVGTAQLATSAALSGPLGVTGVWAGPAVGTAVQLGLLLLLARRGPLRPAPLADQGDRAPKPVG
ncbi:hypothetical protein [Kitasatospora sp. NPDC091276]|uniref:hypothetical protein n=1 Tax=unclassified Kitasatospora TaxID=2633591 RepID=UPI003433A747